MRKGLAWPGYVSIDDRIWKGDSLGSGETCRLLPTLVLGVALSSACGRRLFSAHERCQASCGLSPCPCSHSWECSWGSTCRTRTKRPNDTKTLCLPDNFPELASDELLLGFKVQ